MKALSLEQNGYRILSFQIDAQRLLSIAKFNVRTTEPGSEGLQRKFDSSRSQDISHYLREDEGTLPASIIVNLDLKRVGLTYEQIYNGATGELNLELLERAYIDKAADDKPAFVIDGQHRLKAFDYFKPPYQLFVTAFCDLDLSEIAEIFVKINYYQKPVNKSHVYDLLGINKDLFKDFYALHAIVERLNSDLASPFYAKIKMLGFGDGFTTQASIISAIDKYRLREAVKAALSDGAPAAEQDDALENVIWIYFSSIQKLYPDEWATKKTMLGKSIGIRALFKVLKRLIVYLNAKGMDFSEATVKPLFSNIPRDFWTSNENMVLIGEKGASVLADRIAQAMGVVA